MAELLPCHLFWRHADSFANDSVVGGKQYIARIGESRGESLLYQSDLYGQMLQFAERALRLGKVVHFVAQRRSSIVRSGRLRSNVIILFLREYLIWLDILPTLYRPDA